MMVLQIKRKQLPKQDSTKNKWPNFFIVGAPKAGSTSLYEYLKKIPGIFMSPVKEPNYYCQGIAPNHLIDKPIRNKEKYLNLFKNAKNEVAIGEASSTYLRDLLAPKLIHQAVPNAKIIILLREPISRAYSHYLMEARGRRAHLTFRQVIKKSLNSPENDDYSRVIINGGMYYQQVKRYFDIFGKENVKILIFEEFVKDSRKAVKEILEFLGVKSEIAESVDKVHNPFTVPRGAIAKFAFINKITRKFGRNISYSAREMIVKNVLVKKGNKPPLLQEDMMSLEKIYCDDVVRLEKILGRSLPWTRN